MGQAHFSTDDRRQIDNHGQTLEVVLAQIAMFERGIPFTPLQRPCTVGDGIVAFDTETLDNLRIEFDQAMRDGRVSKFVPASGAASRMFKSLLACLDTFDHIDAAALAAREAQDGDVQLLRAYLEGLPRFAFVDDLKASMARAGLDFDALRARGDHHASVEFLLSPQGLHYADLPKALLAFHRYDWGVRTPLEEHLAEAMVYARDAHGVARLHFTVTPSHRAAMQRHLDQVRQRYERDGSCFEVGFSTQKPSTDTIAVDPENRPFRDAEGRLVFRPGGHGALLSNLQDLDGDIVFIKNIDNVVPDHLKPPTYTYKRALGGYLLQVQRQVFAFLCQLDRGDVAAPDLERMVAFVQTTLSHLPPPDLAQRPRRERQAYLQRVLNRPLRVCGMVQNEDEPGGGPFWVRHPDGSQSIQIVETSQVDMQDAAQRGMVAAATHFNPVDLVCGVRDYRGRGFDLPQFSDPEAGFISLKSFEGRDLKALELPGLWNGAMADWNTVFVEVPLSTFNPVKTVLDLLRPQHRGTA